MFNQTECYSSQDKELHGDSIVAIVVAGCSLVATLGTFAYFKLISKFKDMQQSEIELITEQNGDNNKTVIKVKFVNDEQFEVSSKSSKNGNDGGSSSITNKMLDNLTSIVSSEQLPSGKANTSVDMAEIVVTNFHDAINNNNAGDEIIATTRKGLIFYAFNTFLKTVKMYNVSEEDVIDISENHSRASSAHFHYSQTNADLEDVPNNEPTNKHKVYIPHPTPKIIHRRSLPDDKSDEKKTAIPELSLREQFQGKACILDVKEETFNDTKSNLKDSNISIHNNSNQNESSDQQVQLHTILNIAQNLNDTDREQIRTERFVQAVSNDGGSLSPLIESNNRDVYSNVSLESSVIGASVESASIDS